MKGIFMKTVKAESVHHVKVK